MIEMKQESARPGDCGSCSLVVATMNDRRKAAGLPGRGFSTRGAHLRNLHARHEEHGVGECLRVVRVKADQWLADPKMWVYFRPTTLFRPGHFEEYRAEADDGDSGPELDQWGRLPDGTYPTCRRPLCGDASTTHVSQTGACERALCGCEEFVP